MLKQNSFLKRAFRHGEKNLTIIVSWALPIKVPNLMCKIGMNFTNIFINSCIFSMECIVISQIFWTQTPKFLSPWILTNKFWCFLLLFKLFKFEARDIRARSCLPRDVVCIQITIPISSKHVNFTATICAGNWYKTRVQNLFGRHWMFGCSCVQKIICSKHKSTANYKNVVLWIIFYE